MADIIQDLYLPNKETNKKDNKNTDRERRRALYEDMIRVKELEWSDGKISLIRRKTS